MTCCIILMLAVREEEEERHRPVDVTRRGMLLLLLLEAGGAGAAWLLARLRTTFFLGLSLFFHPFFPSPFLSRLLGTASTRLRLRVYPTVEVVGGGSDGVGGNPMMPWVMLVVVVVAKVELAPFV